MALDKRALQQQKLERAALDALIDQADAWVAEQMASITIDPPPADLDQKGLEEWSTAQLDKITEQVHRIEVAAQAWLQRQRAKAMDLGVNATGRLVRAQLPTMKEVRDGHPDSDRSR